MGRKKRQGDPNASDYSSDSHDENQNATECEHISKAVNLSEIKTRLNKTGLATECDDCNKNPSIENGLEMNGDFEYDTSLWLCLKCGNQACGRYKNKHALKHFATPHSDCHAICVNTSNWSIYCYKCDNEVNVTAKKKLCECVDYIMKHYKPNVLSTNKNILDYAPAEIIDPENDTCTSNTQIESLPNARGLTNLGNTCFFNSVLQCLGQTPYLLELLEETAKPGEYFKLPGGKLHIDDKKSINLEPLDGYLEEWKPLTKILAETLRELKSDRRDVYTPRMLLSKFTQRQPQFGGGDQHDSHELLRHLLEAVREEDLKRYQSVILDKLGYSKKTDPLTVQGEKKKIVKFYGGQASDMLLPTEQVFKGILVSSLQCEDCEHTSHRDENFLDLSLPITEKQIPPMLRRKAEELDDKPSKYQIKKEKKAAKKNKRNKVNKRNENADNEENKTNVNNSDSESDADVEDNIEENISNTTSSVREDNTRGTESGYNSDKLENCNLSNRCSPDMSSVVDIPPLSVSPMSAGSPENSGTSSETNIEMGSPLCGRSSPNDELQETIERPESRMSFVNNKNNDLKEDFTKLSLCYGENYKKEDAGNNYEEAMDDDDEKMDDEVDADLWTTTIAPRHAGVEGECSVQSCLYQFTSCELMTGNNKVSCELCTKRHGGSEKKTINTVAKKQLLIYNPPAVLILHLKRFQVQHYRSAKVNKQVKFPMLLDIAPFTSKRCQNLPTIEHGQTRILYSLYGVVEHGGSIHGGHYVAYVKVRPKLQPNSYRWNFLPKNQNSNNASSEDNQGALGDPEIPAGKWFYISDSYVSQVKESKVLNAQAYLLFYERIL